MEIIIHNLDILSKLNKNDCIDSDEHKLKILEKETTEYENIHSPSITDLIISMFFFTQRF